MILVGLTLLADTEWELLETIRRSGSAQQAVAAERKLEDRLPEGANVSHPRLRSSRRWSAAGG